jgi:anion-transporting  ArsA/GET3 family ATPase
MLERRLLFVTGKGGVGKTAVSAGLALAAAQRGASVLLCDLEGRGDVAASFGVGDVRFAPRPVALQTDPSKPASGQGSLSLMAMDTEASLREYLHLNLRLPLLGRIGPLARTFDFVADAAPGVKEILAVGKLAWEVRERNYDLVIADSPASGHIVGHLAAPQAIAELVQVGLIRSQTDWMLDIIGDPAQTGVVVVTTAEEMPVTETIELLATLRQRTTADIAAVVVNRVLPELFTHRDEALFGELCEGDARRVLEAEVGAGVGVVLDAARLATGLRRRAAGHHDRLRDVEVGVPLLYLPERFGGDTGRAFSEWTATALDEEL